MESIGEYFAGYGARTPAVLETEQQNIARQLA
jgi:hypothetical protein